MSWEADPIIPSGMTPEQAWQKVGFKTGFNLSCSACGEHAHAVDKQYGKCKPCFKDFAKGELIGRGRGLPV